MQDGNLTELIAPLTRLFDDNLRKRESIKGWGQFVAAESHADQIGLYGTSAGILVKTISNPAAHIDDGVITYLRDIWGDRDNAAVKYFHQNVRLAFFLLSIATSADPAIAAIRTQTSDELITRQLKDGGWGDWWLQTTESDTSPRLETTAWAILALSRVNDPRHTDQLRKAGRFLQQNVIGHSNLDEIDPILLSAIIRSLPAADVDKRVHSAAVNLLRKSRPQSDVQIYFFDYVMGPERRRQVKRDFLCVPAFVPYCLLASSLEQKARLSLATVSVAFAHGRSVEYLKKLSETLPFRNPGSKFPATVDQAFLALAVEAASKREVKFGGALKLMRAARNYLANSWVFRVIAPILLATILGAAAKDPNLLWQTYAFATEFHVKDFRTWIESYSSLLQVSAIGISFFIGNPLIMNIKSFIEKKLHF
jgi:hypothetical protein